MENRKVERQALTVDELAAAYGIGRSKAYELVNVPGFPAVRLGRRIIIPCDMLRDWLANQPTVSGVPINAV